MDQPALISGYYRCDNCGKDSENTRRTRRFRLCDECWTKIMPNWDQEQVKDRDPAWYAGTDDGERQRKIEAYWGWYWDMDQRKPSRYRRRSRRELYASFLHDPHSWSVDDYYPYCECGNRREVAGLGSPGIFGGPFARYCAICENRRRVDSIIEMTSAIHPDWDDEEWLDALYRIMPKAFETGVLPDYWFELKRSGAAG